MSKNYIVTGGAGFLGTNLCERLLKDHNRVLIIDDYCTGDQRNARYLKRRYRGCYVWNWDVRESYEPHINNLFDHVDGIFNLASPASPPAYQSMPVHTLLTNVLGAQHAANLAWKYGCKVLHTSTSEVYGDPEIHPQVETYYGNVNSYGKRSCYDEGKRAAEALLHDYHHRHGVDTRIVRIFNTYGRFMQADDGRVVTNFIQQAMRGEPLTIYGDGTQTRSFCYVDDLLDALMVVWNSDYTAPVNIGNPTEYTMLSLARLVKEVTGSKSEINFHPLPADDPTQRCPDTSLAQSLGWEGAKIPLIDGISRTIDYFTHDPRIVSN